MLPHHSAAAFVASRSTEDIAGQLRRDVALINEGQPCSWVALYIPSSKTRKACEIAQHLTPSPEFSKAIKLMLYESMVARLQQRLRDEGIYALQPDIHAQYEQIQNPYHAAEEPSSQQIRTTLEVLGNLEKCAMIDSTSPLDRVVTLLTKMVAAKDSSSESEGGDDCAPMTQLPSPPRIRRKRLCYICRMALTVPHLTQPSMCTYCGDFNLMSSQLSTPSRLTLPADFTALVTGARINLGYYTTLRLLRCGARVLATTRYPRDAAMRYMHETDYPLWKDRLKVLGADFRSAADVFALVRSTRQCLRDWGGAETLHLLVNNAAQTLTDSVSKEQRAIEEESALEEVTCKLGVVISNNYKPRVRGGGLLMALGGAEKERGLLEGHNAESLIRLEPAATDSNCTVGDENKTDAHAKSSWSQSLLEIPYEDVISAHSVNTFVPLILCRELLPIMGGKYDSSKNRSESTKPQAYIINVSSREGIFENQTRSIGKAGKHVHTNMSKAALNMITETEAASAWRSRHVAMNTVDPGYMSAAPECEKSFDGQRPISWEDGAGRILWPVAVGELENRAVWGRFLKHYGVVEIDPGTGRS